MIIAQFKLSLTEVYDRSQSQTLCQICFLRSKRAETLNLMCVNTYTSVFLPDMMKLMTVKDVNRNKFIQSALLRLNK